MPACNQRVAADYRNQGGATGKEVREKATGCEIGCVVSWATRGNAGHNQDPRSLADRAGGCFWRREEEKGKKKTRYSRLGPVLGICYRHSM